MNRQPAINISALTLFLSFMSTNALANDTDGLIKIRSNHSVNETLNNLEAVLDKKGMTIFKRVDHAAGAQKAGLALRPTELLIFGNPKVGTPLMLCSQTAAIDLPQKALVYKDESGQVWLTYNDPSYMAKRHDIKDCNTTIQKIANALAKFASLATK